MNCPSCSFANPEQGQYCIRCRLSFHSRILFLTQCRDHIFWILRRANAGFFSGFVAWIFVPALGRSLSQDFSQHLLMILTGLLGGAFLGAVDGMLERSSPKTIQGSFHGGVGGALGGLLFGLIQQRLGPNYIMWGFFGFWAIAGGTIGLVSALWERRAKKLVAGVIFGAAGGGVGGALGYMMYANLVQNWPVQSWVLNRFYEGFSGGIIGVSLWFFLGFAERFFIFKRRMMGSSQHKKCDFCQALSPLQAWYCGSCGAVLQEAAVPAALNLSPYSTLERLREALRFLSRLVGTTGVIAGLVIFFVFLPIHKVLALIVLVLVGVVAYSLTIFLSALSETVAIFTKR